MPAMTERKTSFDLLKVAGLRPKKPGPEKRYAGFNRRMLAATIDSVLLLFFVPVIESVFNALYGPMPVPIEELVLRLRDVPQEAQMSVFLQAAAETGALRHWLVHGFWQFMVAASLSGFCWHYWAATPGKMLVGIRIADAATEGPVSTRQIILRLFGYIVSTVPLCIGFFWIGLDKRRQSWHDKLAHTVVLVRGREGVRE